MYRYFVGATLLASLFGLVSMFRTGALAQDKGGAASGHVHNRFDACGQACADCMRECETCARHCAMLLIEGKKDHALTMGTCLDCADFCGLAAKLAWRQGPMAVVACEGCAKSCDTCGDACAKFPNDQHMSRCAKACRDCAKACRDMVSHVGNVDSKREQK